METATEAPTQCLAFTLNLCHVPLMDMWLKSWQTPAAHYKWTGAHFPVSWFLLFLKYEKKKETIFHFTSLSLVRMDQQLCCYLLLCTLHSERECVAPHCSSALTSKQYSCPRMLEWTGLMMASSSRVRSSASAALLGDSRDSWEWDSLKLCIKRVLGGDRVVVRWGEDTERRALHWRGHERFGAVDKIIRLWEFDFNIITSPIEVINIQCQEKDSFQVTQYVSFSK